MPDPNRFAVGAPSGVTSIEGDAGFVIWNLAYERFEAELLEDPRALAARIDRYPVSGIAFDLGGASPPTPERTSAVLAFVDELQSRGVSVVIHAAPADFLTAVSIEGHDARIATRSGLADAVSTIREYDEMRQRCTSDRGRRINQLRMPARALSLAPLCTYVLDRLELGGVDERTKTGLLRECYESLGEILANAYPRGDGDLSISVTVHDGRATITLLDAGPPHEAVAPRSAGNGVDRVHRFRVLDRHNAVVLEKDLVALAPG